MAKTSVGLLVSVAFAALILMALAPLTGKAVSSALSQVSIPSAKPPADFLSSVRIYQPLDANGRTHAQNTHSEADDVYNSCRSSKPIAYWLEKNNRFVHLLCKMNNGMGIGDWVFEIGKGVLIEKSAYVPKDGTMARISEWLEAKPAVEIKLDTLLKLMGG